jgi:hypothetical protein
MAKKQTNTITINGTDYTEDQLTESQKVMVNHVADLDRKIGSANFNLDQLKMGRMAFMQSLTASLATDTEEETDVIN